jgi:hypothetical protein
MGAAGRTRFAAEVRKALTDGLAYEISRGIATPAEAVEHLRWIEPALKSGKFFKTYDSVVNYIKRWNIGTPGAIQRNLICGVFNNMAYGRGVEAESYAWAVKNLFSDPASLSAEDLALRNSIESVIGKGQYATEMQGIGEWVNGVPATKRFNPLSSKNAALSTLSNGQEKVERLLRGALAHQVIKDFGGAEVPMAMERANEWVSKLHVNYDDLSKGERQIRRVIPFYTWVSRNMPLQVENMALHPQLFSRYRATQDAFNRTYDGRSPDKVVPDYFKALGAFALPGPNGGGGRLYMAQNLPFSDLMDAATSPSLLGTAQNVLSRTTPLIKTPLELTFGQQAFKGLPLRDDVVTPAGPKVVGDWIGRALEPLGLSQQGGSGQWYTSEKVAYALDQYLPALAQARRVMPQSVSTKGMSASQQKKVKDYSDRQMSSVVSYLLGLNVRTNTRDEQNAQMALWERQNKSKKSSSHRLNALTKLL